MYMFITFALITENFLIGLSAFCLSLRHSKYMSYPNVESLKHPTGHIHLLVETLQWILYW